MRGLVVAIVLLVPVAVSAQDSRWRQGPDLPDREGFAGSFAGVSGGALLVGGGANFPTARPWEGGTKSWYSRVFALTTPDGPWRVVGELPRACGYGVSITIDDGLLCLGGADGQRHFRDSFVLNWDGSQLRTRPMPPLPQACANLTGARLGDTLYVAGGIEAPESTVALKTFWSLDLKHPELGWRSLEPWPGPPRMLAVAGVQDGSFFLLSGVDLSADADGKPVRTYLHDAYRYTPGKSWRRLADLPRAVAAAPTPATAVGPSHLFVLGGDDGRLVGYQPVADHPGFPHEILGYHTITNTWTRIADLPVPLVTTPTANWHDRTIVPGGELRPGVRSPQVWSFRAEAERVQFGWLNYATLTLYPLIMVGISLIVGRKGTTDEFFRGGQRIPWWAAGLSIFATVLSSITYMSIPAKAYATDWSFTLANLAIILIAPVVVYGFLPYFRQLDVTTAYEYLERRFNRAARWFGSLSFIVLQLGRTAIVLYLPALALATVSQFSLEICLVIMGGITLAMTFMGGIESVIWTDVAQAAILFVGAAAALILVALALPDGWMGIWQGGHDDGKFFRDVPWGLDPTVSGGWIILLGNMLVLLGTYVGSQDVVQRYVSTPTQAGAARAIWLNAFMTIPATLLFFSVGTALYAFYKVHPDHLDPQLATEAIFPLFMVREMPAGLGGIAVAGVFAAAQPTSSLNSIATAWVTDFHAHFFPSDSDAKRLRVARWVTLLSAVGGTGLAYLMTRVNARSSFDTFLSLLGLTGSALVGLYVLGVCSTRASGRGAMVGAVTSIGVLYYTNKYTTLSLFTYGFIGISTCCLVGWLASLALPDRSRDLTGLTVYTLDPRKRKAPAP